MLHALGPDFSRRGNLSITPFDNQITVTGMSGVGTTSTVKKLQEVLGPMDWRFVSVGSKMRVFAAKEGMTIEQFAAACRDGTTPSGLNFDALLHDTMRQYARQNHTVIEGRLAHLYAPLAFHVLITCPMAERAARRYRDAGLASYDEAVRLLTERDAADAARFDILYPGWRWPVESFDFVWDTSVPQSFERLGPSIIEAHRAWLEKHPDASDDVLVDQLPLWQ